MADLSAFIPRESETVKAIYDWHKRLGDSEPQRGYLGASIIGKECDRALWYTFRNCCKPEFSGRLYRLFETGDLAEPRFVKELRAIGCTIHEVDPETGEQFEVSAFGGHFSGHTDGCGLGIPEAPETWHVLEFKTHNAKSFAKLEKEGVAKSKPQHYAQMMVYMGLTGMKRALYLAVNKDTDELYAERIRFNADEFHALMNRAERIITAQNAPERIASRPDDFRCRFCDAKAICWGSSEIAVPLPGRSCRSCCHATPEINNSKGALWSCALLPPEVSDITRETMRRGCEHHLLLPSLVAFAEPVDAGDDWIEFSNLSDGAVWRHGPGGDMWTTEELIAGPGPLDGPKQPDTPPFLDEHEEPPITQRYPWGDSELLWDGPPEEINEALEALGLGDLLETVPTCCESTPETGSCEFADHAVAIVTYTKDNHAAIWRGKE